MGIVQKAAFLNSGMIQLSKIVRQIEEDKIQASPKKWVESRINNIMSKPDYWK